MLKSPKLPDVCWVIISNNGKFIARKTKSSAKSKMKKMIHETQQWPEVRYVMGLYARIKEQSE